MNRFAVLAPGFEHLSYPLDRHHAADGSSFTERSEQYLFCRAQSEPHAQMSLLASDFLSEHTCEPVGYVCSGEGEMFVVCRSEGRSGKGLAGEDRLAFPIAVVRRLASLHSQGFGCGGIAPDAVEFSGKEAKLFNPSKIYALQEGDSPYYEAVSTLRALVSSGAAKVGDLPRLASAYLSYSPVCRHGIFEHLQRKGINSSLHQALAGEAKRFAAYF